MGVSNLQAGAVYKSSVTACQWQAVGGRALTPQHLTCQHSDPTEVSLMCSRIQVGWLWGILEAPSSTYPTY